MLEPEDLPLSIAEPPDGSSAGRVGGPRRAERPPPDPVRPGRAACRSCFSTRTCPRTSRPTARSPRASTAAATRCGSSRRSCSASAARAPWTSSGSAPTIRHINEGHAAFVSLEKIRRLVQEEHLTFAEAREVRDQRQHLHDPHARPGRNRRLHARAPLEVLRRLRRRARHHLRRALRSRPRGRGPVPGALLDGGPGDAALDAPERRVEAARRSLAPALAGRRAGPPALGDPDPCRSPTACTPPTWTAPEIVRDGRRRSARRPSTGRRSGRRTSPCGRGWSRPAAKSSSRRRSGARAPARKRSPRRRRVLDPKALTIGFARRFATYKRATLLFREPKRLEYLLHQIERPVQFLFAGKAHPRDEPGKEFLRTVANAAERPELRGASSSCPTTTWGSRAPSSRDATSG